MREFIPLLKDKRFDAISHFNAL
ncbi:hypothetical protein CCP4SC76_6050002 [Gammaproteobacteria bacterium]